LFRASTRAKYLAAVWRPEIDASGTPAGVQGRGDPPSAALPRWRGRARAWLVRFPRALPAALFLAVAAITALSVYTIENNDHQRSRAEVRQYAQEIASALDRRGNSFSSYLRAGAALFATVEDVSPQTFGQFVAELRLDQNYRGAEGIGWIALVERSDIGRFLERVRVGQPDFPDIAEGSSASSDVIAPVTFFSPDTIRNRRALGIDMYSEPVRAAAMDEAGRTVMPIASGKVVLAQDDEGGAPGIVIFMPVYKPVPGSPALERRLAGYIFSSFNAEQFLDAAIERAAPTELGVRLYDGAAASRNLLVSRSLGEAGVDRFEQPVMIANRQFLLVIDSAGSRTLAPLSTATLVFGLALAVLLTMVVRLLTKQALEDEARLAFLEEQHSIRNSLSRELNHRVKNTLANVLSILSLTRRRARNLDDFADSLEGRIRSLSATHDLLTESEWGTTPIRAVIEAEMHHFGEGCGQTITIDGPPVELAPNDALSFGLAIHELATNAAKFGALSAQDGSVSVRWRLAADTIAEVEWCERDGPPVPEARGRGFGTELIEKIIAHELRQPVKLEFRAEGVRCVLRVPVRRRGEFRIRGS
jgi:two-component sensor histidine kinase